MDLLLKNISNLVSLSGAAAKAGRHVNNEDLGIAKNMSMLIHRGRIAWIGPLAKFPKQFAKDSSLREHNMKGLTVLPGLVECHTHLIFAGNRAAEFELRNTGVSYQEIAARGGGILSSMKSTRRASLEQLVQSGQQRADHFISQGVTTVEIKSGYGLSLKDEVKALEAAQKIKKLRTVCTFLGAHALPPEFSSYASYLQFLADKVLPVIRKKKLARRVDVFIEKGFFPPKESEAYLQRAKDLGFEIVVHADQLSLSGGSEVAIRTGALSGDHLLQIGPKEIQNIAKSEVTCVLLPAADLYMKSKYPPARNLIDAGARVALATDFNPGSSPTQDLNLVGLLARLEMKMTLPEVIGAYTVGAAYALNLQKEIGSLELGKSADLLCTESDWQTLFYSVGESSRKMVFARGKLILNQLI